MNEGNLIRNEDLTPAERRERASKAGRASVAARRKKTALGELLKIALSMPSADGDRTNAEAIAASMIDAALMGDVKAFVAIRDTIGERPASRVEFGIADNLCEDILGVQDASRAREEAE